MAESEEELKSLLMKVKKERFKAWEELNPLVADFEDGETVERVSDLIFGAPKSLQMLTAVMKWKDAYSLEGKLWPT